VAAGGTLSLFSRWPYREGSARSAAGLLEDGFEHVEDEPLAGPGQAAELLEVALELGGRPAFAGAIGQAEQGFDGDGEVLGQGGQERDREPAFRGHGGGYIAIQQEKNGPVHFEVFLIDASTGSLTPIPIRAHSISVRITGQAVAVWEARGADSEAVH